ncbi:MAG: DUF1684 domain-containing protein [Balneolales bacterium]|nr:DUF1684 domain-containing protein [Balneolales bacterium]
MKYVLGLLTASLFFASCTSDKDLGAVEMTSSYNDEVEDFYEYRRGRLTEPFGWLRLTGMYWLEEGENTFGSGSDNDIVFPEVYIPERAGSFWLEGDSVQILVKPEAPVTIEDLPVRPDRKVLFFSEDLSPMANQGSLHWRVIRRDDLLGIRLYNTDNEVVDAFTGFDRYEVDPKYNVKARFRAHEEPTTVSVVNVLGQESEVNSPGRLHFHLDGEPFSLIALEGNDRMFLILGDKTNRSETFQGGRYMYIDYPEDGSDITSIDFNKAYNPPCAFSEYTTCQFPPRENILETFVRAGEKRPDASFLSIK